MAKVTLEKVPLELPFWSKWLRRTSTVVGVWSLTQVSTPWQATILAVALCIGGIASSGPITSSFKRNLLGLSSSNNRVAVVGVVECAPGYESVKEELIRAVRSGVVEAGQVCAYANKKLVVNLFVSICGKGVRSQVAQYDENSVQAIHTCGMFFESVAMAMLVDRGLINYYTTISSIWPEFAEYDTNKINVCLEDVLLHQAGCENVGQLPCVAFQQGYVHEAIEQCQASFASYETRERNMHIVTRGIILDEICKRVDPRGRSLSSFLNEEVYQKVGVQDYLFTSSGKSKLTPGQNLVPWSEPSALWVWTSLFWPCTLGGQITNKFMTWFLWCLIRPCSLFLSFDPFSVETNSFKHLAKLNQICNSISHKSLALTSTNHIASATAMAQVLNALVSGNLLSKKGLEQGLQSNSSQHVKGGSWKVKLTQSGLQDFDWLDGDIVIPNAVGYAGMNGSLVACNLNHSVAFAFNTTMVDPGLQPVLASRLYQRVLKSSIENKID